MLYYVDRFLRSLLAALFTPAAFVLIPVKLAAWRTRSRWVRGVLLEITGALDWLTVVACIQNRAMVMQHRAWKGNFLFGRAVFLVEHERATAEIPRPTLRGNLFMGVHLVSNEPGVFLTNAGPITTAPPVRTASRRYIDEVIMTDRVRAFEHGGIETACAGIIDEWRNHPYMASSSAIRTVATRIYLRLLAEVEPSYAEAERLTSAYTRRFGEMSLLGRYLPSVMGMLSTLEALREDVFLPLRRMGVDPVAIDMTMFAAMFSNGTWALHAVRLAREEKIDYRVLDPHQRIGFLLEVQRVYPTVTTVHRVVEAEETVEVRGEPLTLRPGQEVCYPFVIINRDPKAFSEPSRFSFHRPPEELARILSWSVGPHVCPAKDLSIQVAKTMLDALSARFDLRRLRIFAVEF